MVRRMMSAMAAVVLVAADARAQTAGDALRNLLFEPSEGTGAFSKNASEALYGLLLGETTTFPIGSSAGGFTWSFDSALNVPKRRSQSFGPMFAERPFTTGLHKLNVGVAFQHTKFDSVAGQSLTNLEQSVSYNFGESFYNTASSLAVTIDRTVVSATYGVTDRLDIGVLLPVSRATVSGSSSFSYKEVDGSRSTGVQTSSGASSGIGDIIVRAKGALFSAHNVDGAIAVDLRLPTGDADKLLGTGQTQAKVQFIAADTIERVTPHVNLGYTFGGSGLTFGPDTRFVGSFGDPELLGREPSQEINYTAGLDVAASSTITVAGDIIGRSLKNSAKLSLFDSGAASPDRLVFFQVDPGNVALLLGAVGVKVNVGGLWLATATILFPLNDNGIKPHVTPVVGFERAF
jgi:hypothetical protein